MNQTLSENDSSHVLIRVIAAIKHLLILHFALVGHTKRTNEP
jgi:hypothetical protein